MVIIINKDLSTLQVTPTTVYQGSNLASELTVFAPFSVSSYPAILCNFLLPSGKYLPSLIAFYAPEQPNGFGAWTTTLPASVTALSGTVKVSFAFIGASHTIDKSTTPPTVSGSGPIMTTEAAEFTVQATVSALPDLPAPDGDIYAQIISSLASILQRQPDWTQDSTSAPDYIKNKPPIVPLKNGQGEATGARVNGDLEVTESLTVDGDLEVIGDLTIDGNNLDELLDTKVDKISPDNAGTYVYVVEKYNGVITNKSLPAKIIATPEAIPLYDASGRLTTKYPSSYSDDCVNVGYFKEKTATRLLYDGSTGVLSLADANDNVLGWVDLPLEMTVSGARYEDGFLILTFTNGETVRISLKELMLPAWVTDLNNIPSGSENVPPTAEAVKEYVAPVVRNTVTGTAFVVDDYAENINNNYISASTAANVNIYGQNLLDPSKFTASSGESYISVSGNEITWKAGAKYELGCNVFIPKGSTVLLLYDWDATSGDASDGPGVHRLVRAEDGTLDKIVLGTPFVAQYDYRRLILYKTSVSTALVGDVKITNLSLSYALNEPYTPFVGKRPLQLSAGQSQTVDLDEFNGFVTIISETTDVPVTLQYTRDLSKTIDNLSKKIADLQNAIAT